MTLHNRSSKHQDVCMVIQSLCIGISLVPSDSVQCTVCPP